MNAEDAEEYTQSLGQIVAGSWRQVALAKRLGVPKALGLSTEDWVNGRLGGYVRLSVSERREAAKELTINGLTQRDIGEVLGVDQKTISNDLREENSSTERGQSSIKPGDLEENSSPIDAMAALAADERIRQEARRAEVERAKAMEREASRPIVDAGCTVDDLNTLIAAGQKFSVIYADPPWEFKVYSGKGKKRSAERYYNTKSLDDIKALPIEALAADDCALLLWAVCPELPGALEVIKAWGFTYKTVGFTWIKENRSGDGLKWGMGYWTRANAELCLLATRGSPKRQAMDVFQVVQTPIAEHSRKPDEVQVRIERLLNGPYLELYGRRAVPGWTVWGNEISRNLFQQDIPEFSSEDVA